MDPSYELIAKMFEVMKARTSLTDLVPGTSIYDRAPDGVILTYPYISLGPTIVIPADAECSRAEEITVQWDVWTSGPNEQFGSVMCRKICHEIKLALHDVDLALTINAVVTLQCDMIRILDDPNPAIRHGVVSLTGEVETPE